MVGIEPGEWVVAFESLATNLAPGFATVLSVEHAFGPALEEEETFAGLGFVLAVGETALIEIDGAVGIDSGEEPRLAVGLLLTF